MSRHGAWRRRWTRWRQRGLTVVELLVAFAVIAIVSALLVPYLVQRITESKLDRAAQDIRSIADDIVVYSTELGEWPESLDELPGQIPNDPWGNPYQYLSSNDKKWRGKARRDRFLVPLNSDFDLYSSGPDGESVAPLTAKKSRDDIIRADDGGFYGAAADF